MSSITTTRRTNKYASVCVTCGGTVPAGAGILGSKLNGRWTAFHTTCPRTPAMPIRPQVCSGDVHGAYDDECKGSACVQPMRPATDPACGVTGCEAHDGECRDDWGRNDRTCYRHGDVLDAKGDCFECRMERLEAARDRDEDYRVAAFKAARDARLGFGR